MKIKKIFSRRIAFELRKRGCRIVGTEPNIYKPEFDVYLFEDTPRLRELLTEVTATL